MYTQRPPIRKEEIDNELMVLGNFLKGWSNLLSINVIVSRKQRKDYTLFVPIPFWRSNSRFVGLHLSAMYQVGLIFDRKNILTN
jgi:hypothetical protein